MAASGHVPAAAALNLLLLAMDASGKDSNRRPVEPWVPDGANLAVPHA